MTPAETTAKNRVGRPPRHHHAGAGAAPVESRCFMAPNCEDAGDRTSDGHASVPIKYGGVQSQYSRDESLNSGHTPQMGKQREARNALDMLCVPGAAPFLMCLWVTSLRLGRRKAADFLVTHLPGGSSCGRMETAVPFHCSSLLTKKRRMKCRLDEGFA
jgi:hypothetical protein